MTISSLYSQVKQLVPALVQAPAFLPPLRKSNVLVCHNAHITHLNYYKLEKQKIYWF